MSIGLGLEMQVLLVDQVFGNIACLVVGLILLDVSKPAHVSETDVSICVGAEPHHTK